jgi:hypothetical protein
MGIKERSLHETLKKEHSNVKVGKVKQLSLP